MYVCMCVCVQRSRGDRVSSPSVTAPLDDVTQTCQCLCLSVNAINSFCGPLWLHCGLLPAHSSAAAAVACAASLLSVLLAYFCKLHIVFYMSLIEIHLIQYSLAGVTKVVTDILQHGYSRQQTVAMHEKLHLLIIVVLVLVIITWQSITHCNGDKLYKSTSSVSSSVVTWFVMKLSAKRLSTLRPSQPTWTVSPPVGCHHLLLQSPFVIFTQPESWYSYYPSHRG